jgi:hypothetical protein
MLGLPDRTDLVPLGRSARWPHIRISRQPLLSEPRDVGRDERRACLELTRGAYALLDRESRSATLLTAYWIEDERAIELLLEGAASVFGWWDGRDVFQAGAFVSNGGAWGLLGERGAGKSTLLGDLASAGYPILTDDLLVVADGVGLAGPRWLNVRADARPRFILDGTEAKLRFPARQRRALDPVAVEVGLQGWIFLSWGPKVSLQPLSLVDRMRRLVAQRIAGSRVLDLSRLSAFELKRPSTWNAQRPALQQLLETVNV